jgi:hypothetical protein
LTRTGHSHPSHQDWSHPTHFGSAAVFESWATRHHPLLRARQTFSKDRSDRDKQWWLMSKWLKLLLFGVWGLLLIPVIGTTIEKWFQENILSEPSVAVTTASKSLVAVSELRWFKFTLVFMTGIVIGISLETSARKSGERKAFELRSLGYKFRSLSDNIKAATISSGKPDSARDIRPAILSAFSSARRFDLWVPSERVFELPDGSFLCEYLRSVGMLLENGRLDEASREALSWKPFLDRAKPS